MLRVPRPFLHHVMIAAYASVPVIQYFLFLFLARQDADGNLFALFKGITGVNGTLILYAMPLAAIALYMVSRISWFVFMLHGMLLIFDNIVKCISYPNVYYLSSLALSGIALVALVFALRKDFRIAYLVKEKRGFRMSPRYSIAIAAILNGANCSLTMISQSGGYLSLEDPHCVVGSKVFLSLLPEGGESVSIEGVVTFTSDSGVGLQFAVLPGSLHALYLELKNKKK